MSSRIIIPLVLVLVLVGCRAGPPWAQWMFKGPPGYPEKEYPELYVEGWVDGCHTGAAATSGQWYAMFYDFKQDAIKAQNRVYYKGWKDAFEYCQRYLYQYRKRRVL